jgi:SAM-dependent methyltransferase
VCPHCGKAPVHREGFLSFIVDTPQDLESFDKGYFPELYKLEHDHFWFRYRNSLIIWALEKYFPKIQKILEIGCGTAFVLSELYRYNNELTLSGSDLYFEALLFANTRLPKASFYQMDACAIPFQDEYDLIMALDILEHVENDVIALGEIYCSLKTGGGLFLTVPQHKWLWSMHDEKAFHKRRYTWQELEGKMVSCGFKVVYHTSFISLLLPIMIASRLVGALFLKMQKSYDPLRELRISPVANTIFNIVCILEERLVKMGYCLPTGGSLLCIGMK